MFSLSKHGSIKLRLSRFGHIFKNSTGDWVCFYNALTLKRVYAPVYLERFFRRVLNGQTVFEVMENLSYDELEEFKKLIEVICGYNIFVPAEYEEMKYLDKVRKIAFTGPNIRVLVLHLTDFCNLRCRYCFIEGNIPEDYQRKKMSKQVIKSSLAMFGRVISGKQFPKSPSIVFYGGEPLLNFSGLAFALEQIEEMQAQGVIPDIEKIIITNGVLLNDEMVKVIKKHQVMVSVSIDGPEDIHDANRIFAGGRGSFQETFRGFQLLKSADVQPTVSCVLSKQSLEHVERIIRWIVEELGVRALGFNHVSIVPSLNSYDPEYEQNFALALIRAQEMIQERYKKVYERRMNYKINNFIDENILRADCTGCGEQMSVSPDGQIGICQGYMGSRKTFDNDVFNSKFNPNRDKVFLEWSRRSPLTMEQCFDCIALATCGGGCPRNADYINGSIWETDSAFCHFAKLAQQWMIWKCFEQEKDLL